MGLADVGVIERGRLFTPAFTALALATFLSVLPAGMLLPTVPLYAQSELGAGSLAVGVAVGATSLTSFLTLPFVGRLGDRHGRKRFLLAGPLIIGVAAASLHFATALVVLVAIRVFSGVGEAMVAVSATTAAADLAPPHRRGEAISVFSLAFQGGLAVGPVLATELVRSDRFWLVWTVAAGSAFAATAVASRVPETRPTGFEQGRRTPLVVRAALAPGLILGLALVGYGGFSAFGAIYARELGLARVGLIFLLFATIVIGIRAFGRRIPDILGAERCAGAALILIASGLVLIAGFGSLPGLFVGTALLAAGQALAFPALLSLAVRRTSPDERSSVVGTIAAGSQAAIGGGAILLGAIAAVTGYGTMFLAGAIAAICGLAILSRLRPG